MFVGRTDLIALGDLLTEAPRRDGTPRPRPVLVLEGCGGSGRTAMLQEYGRRWDGRTHSALVSPLDYEPEEPDDEADRDPVRPLVAAVSLRLGQRIPGYRLILARTLVAHIALKSEFRKLAPDDQIELLHTELDKYCDPRRLRALVDDLGQRLGELAAGLQLPFGWIFATRALNWLGALLAVVVRARLRRRFRQAVAWFGHRDLRFARDPERELINLSIRARRRDPEIERGVDDVLTGALLADLRESVARRSERTPNILILLDDGDVPAATAFTTSFLRVRQLIRDDNGPTADPVTLVTTTSGFLTTTLDRTPRAEWSDPAVHEHPERIAEPWIRAVLPGLTGSEVKLLAEHTEAFPAEATAIAVTRLTRGHPAGTEHCLRAIGRYPELRKNINALLRSPEPESTYSVEEFLLRVFARSLTPQRRLHPELVEALVTVSAARSLSEARLLAPMLPDVFSPDAPVLTSESLWTGTSAETRRMHPLARYLGLRALAARTDAKAGWMEVCGRLRAAADAKDEATQLHYRRLRREYAAVVDSLTRKLPEMPSESWLRLYDEIVSTLDPVQPSVRQICRGYAPDSVENHIAVLIAAVPVFELDPCVTDPNRRDPDEPEQDPRKHLCLLIGHSYLFLAGHALTRDLFLVRANHYFALAQRYR
ncbi:hypothetical protein [Nocardia transvalensis]|uniref:hypothetical protein n=1 Tax=Nocardia transvalensis TaxID=37333 RepID=UPI00189440F5|nr:hypothetical protein [Nocardia transvalensis]MBF6328175.1 hypothetical protein [Nocardia transvalensis]